MPYLKPTVVGAANYASRVPFPVERGRSRPQAGLAFVSTRAAVLALGCDPRSGRGHRRAERGFTYPSIGGYDAQEYISYAQDLVERGCLVIVCQKTQPD